MSKLNLRTISGAKGFALALVLLVALLVASLLTIPAYAHAPSGASEVDETDLLPVWIYDEDEQLHKFVIEDNDLMGYSKGNELIEIRVDGENVPDDSLSICEVVVYRVLQLAFSQLWPDDVPNAGDFAVTYHHPGNDHKAAFEYITQAFSRGDAQVELDPGVDKTNFDLDAYRYTFTNKDTGETFETWVLEGVFPDGFFELRTKVETDEATEAEKAEFLRQWEETRDKFLTVQENELEADELFEVEEVASESPPYWQISFALALALVVIGSTVYSLTLGRRRR
ncbi:MAG: hypothetical protein KAX23_00365 [Dehalococcoidia bacterium]|jgi:hypothetical protein|nr:hypothetical protein [Chloroflexota bacterium]MCK4241982.1 hypothetical protein [Dehalococcoidia bacterium]